MNFRNGMSEGPKQQELAKINRYFLKRGSGWGISLGGPGVSVNVIRTYFPGSRPIYRSLIYGMIA